MGNETILSLAIQSARVNGFTDEEILSGAGISAAVEITKALLRRQSIDRSTLYYKFLSQVFGWQVCSSNEAVIEQQVKDIVASNLEASKRAWKG
jgi:hypothetical protein